MNAALNRTELSAACVEAEIQVTEPTCWLVSVSTHEIAIDSQPYQPWLFVCW